MNPMTIRDFNWGDFWGTYGSTSWCEFLMASILALVAFRSYRRSIVTIEGKSSIAAFWVAVAAFLGCAYKALNNLDVATIPYAAFFVFAFLDFRTTLRTLRDMKDAEARQEYDARRDALAGGGKRSHSHSSGHSHAHSGRRSHSGGSKRSSKGGSSDSHRHSSTGHSSTERRAKDPKFDDPLAGADASNAESQNE